MKTLHIINRRHSNDTTVALLEQSAAKRNITVKMIFTDDFDFSQPISLTNQDGLYRVSDNADAFLIEKYLLNDQVITLYADYKHGVVDIDNVIEATLLHEKLGLPIIKSLHSLTKNKALLKKYAEFLNGFPIVVKSAGGQHGIGVMRIDSFESLTSVTDYLMAQQDRFILREYIDYVSHARLIVLGDKVIDSIEYKRVANDFRSNAGSDLTVLPKTFSNEIENVAIQAVRSLGYEFGGVDILIDEQGAFYIAEVNFPCYFPRAQHITGVDTSGMIIDYMIEKSRA